MYSSSVVLACPIRITDSLFTVARLKFQRTPSGSDKCYRAVEARVANNRAVEAHSKQRHMHRLDCIWSLDELGSRFAGTLEAVYAAFENTLYPVPVRQIS